MMTGPLLPRTRRKRGIPLRLSGRALGWVLAALLWLPSGQAQGQGVVEGQLVNGTQRAVVPAGVEIDVVGLGGGISIVKSTVTDKAGKFKVVDLPLDTPLMIRANYQSVNYHGQVRFDAAGKASVEIEVFEPTESMQAIRAEDVRLAFQMSGDRLRSMEVYSFDNQTRPPRSFMSREGSLRFAKLPGILEPPILHVTAPGSTMPLTQPALESADGLSYYSLFPLRPGVTTFEVEQNLPYEDRTYTYRKKLYFDVNELRIGVIPRDMTLSGEGVSQVQTNAQENFAVFSGGPLKAGTEVVWTISGGTPTAGSPAGPAAGEARIIPMPTRINQNALILGPLILLGFVVVLWYAVIYVPEVAGRGVTARARELSARREQMLNHLAALDTLHDQGQLNRREYLRQREQGKRLLRRISLLMKS